MKPRISLRAQLLATVLLSGAIASGCSTDPRADMAELLEDYMDVLEDNKDDCEQMGQAAQEFAKDNAPKFKELERKSKAARAAEKVEAGGKPGLTKEEKNFNERFDKAMERMDADELQKCIRSNKKVNEAMSMLVGAS